MHRSRIILLTISGVGFVSHILPYMHIREPSFFTSAIGDIPYLAHELWYIYLTLPLTIIILAIAILGKKEKGIKSVTARLSISTLGIIGFIFGAVYEYEFYLRKYEDAGLGLHFFLFFATSCILAPLTINFSNKNEMNR